ncbi:MAG: hypothetical protein FWE44_03860 [Defluviitaleaceae bacterium]|nr:hypothetical protein [Defluviitaleaceae bacterium]
MHKRILDWVLNKAKQTGRIILYGLFAAIWAYLYYWMTFSYMYEMVEQGLVLEAYLYNLFAIMIVLFFDWLVKKFMFARKYLSKNIFTRIVRFLVLPKSGLVSFKSGLYLFYVFMLLYSMLLTHSPYLEPTTTFEQYVVAMEYGIIILLAIDMFIKQLSSDNNRILELEESERMYDEKQRQKGKNKPK